MRRNIVSVIGVVWAVLALPHPARHFIVVMIAPFVLGYVIRKVIWKVVDRGRGGSVDQDPLVAAWEAAKTTCPDCAETILIDADVCKHCGNQMQREAETSD